MGKLCMLWLLSFLDQTSTITIEAIKTWKQYKWLDICTCYLFFTSTAWRFEPCFQALCRGEALCTLFVHVPSSLGNLHFCLLIARPHCSLILPVNHKQANLKLQKICDGNRLHCFVHGNLWTSKGKIATVKCCNIFLEWTNTQKFMHSVYQVLCSPPMHEAWEQGYPCACLWLVLHTISYVGMLRCVGNTNKLFLR